MKTRLTAAAVAALLYLGFSQLAGAQTNLVLTATYTGGAVQLSVQRPDYGTQTDGTTPATVTSIVVRRCPGAECDPNPSAGEGGVQLTVVFDSEDQTDTVTDMGTQEVPLIPGATYRYHWIDLTNNADADAFTSNTVAITIPAGGGAVDEAVLPNVLRDITRGIHNGIYDRIRQRQQQDGRWK